MNRWIDPESAIMYSAAAIIIWLGLLVSIQPFRSF